MKQMWCFEVRDEELEELDRHRLDSCHVNVAGGSENTYGKVNILLQTYISQGRVDNFSLVSDTAYVAQVKLSGDSSLCSCFTAFLPYFYLHYYCVWCNDVVTLSCSWSWRYLQRKVSIMWNLYGHPLPTYNTFADNKFHDLVTLTFDLLTFKSSHILSLVTFLFSDAMYKLFYILIN